MTREMTRRERIGAASGGFIGSTLVLAGWVGYILTGGPLIPGWGAALVISEVIVGLVGSTIGAVVSEEEPSP